ncbi:spore germination protein [Paenibacillus turpanensis]|uniref:spore germination protein n=1 Tax=Paenibacillus turpanensis TaxID=2689078 RepID=UPI00140A0A57|nr:spore germination protein [Paenibacillus turpanensis]
MKVKEDSKEMKQGGQSKKSPFNITADLVLTPREQELKETENIAGSMEEVKRTLEEQVGLGVSFDAVLREMTFGGVKCGLFYFNGFAKDEVLTLVIDRLTYISRQELQHEVIETLFARYIPHIQVEKVDNMKDALDKAMAGGSVLFIEGQKSCIVIDAKQFPQRGPEEPTLERVVRGSRDGFIETLMTNVTLLRRRLRDPRLKLELQKTGVRTKNDVCIAYINDIADMSLVKDVKKKLENINYEGFPMADKQIEEALVGKGWNPYPVVRYSERPDVVATHLLEGHVAIFVDTSPSAMILPTTLFHHVQHAEENRQTPFLGTYMRWVRYLGIFASIFLLPLWFLYVYDPALKPTFLDVIGPQKDARLPILLQFFLVEVGIDLLRLAAIHTPTPLATALGLIAAVLVGQVAVEAGLFINEVIIYMAVAGIGTFATPSYELGLANRVVRLFLLALVGLFKVPGLVAGTTFVLLMLAVQRSYNSPYLWPFIPFNARGMLDVIIRRPVLTQKYRPTITKPYDRTRMGEGGKENE